MHHDPVSLTMHQNPQAIPMMNAAPSPPSALTHVLGRMEQCLDSRKEEHRYYPIQADDLIFTTACPVCGSGEAVTLVEVSLPDDLVFHATAVCRSCLFVFRPVSPSYHWFQRCWARIATGTLEVFNTALETERRERYRIYLGLMQACRPTGRVLDVGAAYGSGTQLFAEAGYQVSALEPENDRANYIRRSLGIPVYQTVLQTFESEPGTWDIVLLSHCLEHVDGPAEILAKVHRWLVPGGLVYLEVPDLWDIVDWTDGLFMTHKSNFTPENLSWLVRRQGFDILQTRTIPRTAGETSGFALVLQRRDFAEAHDETAVVAPFVLTDPAGSLIAVQHCYRKDLSDLAPPLDQPVLLRVPYLDQFYHTIRRDCGRFVREIIPGGQQRLVFVPRPEPPASGGARSNAPLALG